MSDDLAQDNGFSSVDQEISTQIDEVNEFLSRVDDKDNVRFYLYKLDGKKWPSADRYDSLPDDYDVGIKHGSGSYKLVASGKSKGKPVNKTIHFSCGKSYDDMKAELKKKPVESSVPGIQVSGNNFNDGLEFALNLVERVTKLTSNQASPASLIESQMEVFNKIMLNQMDNSMRMVAAFSKHQIESQFSEDDQEDDTGSEVATVPAVPQPNIFNEIAKTLLPIIQPYLPDLLKSIPAETVTQIMGLIGQKQ